MLNNPTKVKDYKYPISNTRQEFLEEENTKIIGTKGMVFKKFMTERERLDKYIKENEKTQIYYEINRSRNKSTNSNKSFNCFFKIDLSKSLC